MEYKYTHLEMKDGIGYITFDNPKNMNAINVETGTEFAHAIQTLEENEDIRVVIITGAGKAFVAGGDLAAMKDRTSPEGYYATRLSNGNLNAIGNSRKVYIAAINGFALGGGCELACACDFRYSNQYAKFGQPEVKYGILPGNGGSARLPRIVGLSKAKELVFTGEFINAEEALEIGLVDKVVPAEELIATCEDLARRIMKNPRRSIEYAKKALNMTWESHLSTGLAYENSMWGLCFATQDQKEGMAAFVEKREPNFIGD